jgi:ABC-type multidrug transport system ATPase subunit
MLGGVVVFLGAAFFAVLQIKKKLEHNGYTSLSTEDAEAEAQRRHDMMSNHIPCTIMFRNINYMMKTDQRIPESFSNQSSTESLDEDMRYIPNSGFLYQVVLEGIQGAVRPGEVMAIMGGSGAGMYLKCSLWIGKTTLLDILARKNKSGIVTGDILVNGEYMDYEKYKNIIGFAFQNY